MPSAFKVVLPQCYPPSDTQVQDRGHPLHTHPLPTWASPSPTHTQTAFNQADMATHGLRPSPRAARGLQLGTGLQESSFPCAGPRQWVLSASRPAASRNYPCWGGFPRPAGGGMGFESPGAQALPFLAMGRIRWAGRGVPLAWLLWRCFSMWVLTLKDSSGE